MANLNSLLRGFRGVGRDGTIATGSADSFGVKSLTAVVSVVALCKSICYMMQLGKDNGKELSYPVVGTLASRIVASLETSLPRIRAAYKSVSAAYDTKAAKAKTKNVIKAEYDRDSLLLCCKSDGRNIDVYRKAVDAIGLLAKTSDKASAENFTKVIQDIKDVRDYLSGAKSPETSDEATGDKVSAK